MKKVFLIVLVGIMVLSLAACGGGGRADEAYVGNWVSVAGTALGYTLTGDDISGFALALEDGGKGAITIEGEETNIKWTNDDTNLTVTLQGEELVGVIGEDTLVFTNLLNTGMDLTFAKEGTDAAKPENALPDNEKAVIGTWVSNKVTDVLEEDASGAVAPDAMKLTFKSDHTADIEFNGKTYSNQKWSMLDTFGFLDDGGELDLTWDTEGEELKVTYNGEEYWIFTCAKQ